MKTLPVSDLTSQTQSNSMHNSQYILPVLTYSPPFVHLDSKRYLVLYFSKYSFLYKKDCFDAPKTKRKNPDTNHCFLPLMP